MKRQLEPGLT